MKYTAIDLTSDLDAYSLEGFFNFTGIANYIKGFFPKFNTIVTSASLMPSAIIKTDSEKAIIKIKAASRIVLSEYMIYAPEYLSKDIVGYLTILANVLAELKNIEKDLLHPIYMWLANIYSDPETVNKIWVNLPPAHSTVLKHSEKLHNYFSVEGSDGLHRRLFNDIYKDAQNLATADKVLSDLGKEAGLIMTNTLVKKIDDIVGLTAELNRNSDQKALQNLPAEKLKYAADVIYRAASELELLAIVLFQIKVTTFAHLETVKKINSEL